MKKPSFYLLSSTWSRAMAIHIKSLQLTTFWRSKSNLSHFNRVTSCFKPSICTATSADGIILFGATTPSKHNEHAFVVASADDIDSKPVSLSTYVAPPSKRVNTFDDEKMANRKQNKTGGGGEKAERNGKRNIRFSLFSCFSLHNICIPNVRETSTKNKAPLFNEL